MTTSGYERRNRWVLRRRRKVDKVGDDVTSFGGLFHVWAEATLKDRLPIVISLYGGTTRRLVSAERRPRRPGKSATRACGPRYRVALSHAAPWTSARPSWTGFAPERPANEDGKALQWCGRSDVDDRSTVLTHWALTGVGVADIGGQTNQHANAVIQSRQNESYHQRLESGWRHQVTNLSQLSKYGETPRYSSLHVRSHYRVGVNKNTKITNWRHRVYHDTVDQ